MKKIDETLIVRCLAGDADEKERKELARALASSDEVAKEFIEVKNVWDASVSPETASWIDTEKSFKLILKKIGSQRNTGDSFHNKAMNIITKVAACLSVPFMLMAVYLYFDRHSRGTAPLAVSQEITAMPGSLVHTMLPDSTEIWINGDSRISYKQEGKGARHVEIDGEVFFKVHKDPEHPFKVNTATGLGIEALGTQFNVCSYARDSIAAVTLTEGSVRVNDSKWAFTMSPRQTVVYNSNKKRGELYTGNTDKNISWKNGKLAFINEPLKNVYKRLGLIYDVSFEVDPKLANVILYANFEKPSFDQMLTLIQKSTPLTYQVHEDGEGKKTIKVIGK